jgi:hypothetical protein
MTSDNASPDDPLVRLMRTYYERELRAIEAAGVPPPPAVGAGAAPTPASLRRPVRQVPPGVWTDAPWVPLLGACTPGWANKAGLLKRNDSFPLNGWVQAFRKPGKPGPDGRSEGGQWYIRLLFPRAENPSAVPDQPGPLELYENAFFDVGYSAPSGREHHMHLRVALDTQGDLASEWRPMELACDPTEYRLRVCFSAKPVDLAGASCARPPAAAAVRAVEDHTVPDLWEDFGGEA